MAEENVNNKDLDLSQIQDIIKSQVETHLNQLKESTRSNTQNDTNNTNPQNAAKAQLREILRSGFGDDLDKISFKADSALDAVNFYLGNPDAQEYKTKVEEIFSQMEKIGRPTPREDILKHILGNEFASNKEEFVKKYNERKQKELNKAQYGIDMADSGSIMNPKEYIAEFEKLSIEDMEKVLEGHTF